MAQPNTTWTTDDAIALRNLTWLPKLMMQLKAMKPKAVGKSLEERAINAAERDGYDLVLDNITSLQSDVTSSSDKPDFVNDEPA